MRNTFRMDDEDFVSTKSVHTLTHTLAQICVATEKLRFRMNTMEYNCHANVRLEQSQPCRR